MAPVRSGTAHQEITGQGSQGFGPGLSTVLATGDGGATWQVAGTAGMLGSMLAVSDANTLWAGGQAESGPVERPILAVSRDGGASWTDVRLPVLEGQSGPRNYLPVPPQFDDPSTGIVLVNSRGMPTYGGSFLVFGTTDGGKTWSWTGAVGVAGDFTGALLDADHVWVQPGPPILDRSADAGQVWEQLNRTGLPESPIETMSFWDAQTGIAVVPTGDTPARGTLFRTDDGGRSWRKVDVGSHVSSSQSSATSASFGRSSRIAWRNASKSGSSSSRIRNRAPRAKRCAKTSFATSSPSAATRCCKPYRAGLTAGECPLCFRKVHLCH